jgi:hypothetical protein
MTLLEAISDATEACRAHAEASKYLPHEAKPKLLGPLEADKNAKVKLALAMVKESK